MKEAKLLTSEQLNKIKDFIDKNSYWIYNYINDEILKNIGTMNPNYFVKNIQEIFTQNANSDLNENISNPNILPYIIFTLLEKTGKIDYTSLRVETINFKQIDKEASVYYNYVKFALVDDFLAVNLMQTKIGGMPIDNDIVKFSKKIAIKKLGLEEYITTHKETKKIQRIDEIVSNPFLV